MICSFTKSIRRPEPRRPGPGNIDSGRWRPLPTCSSHLWREASTHHAGGTRPRLHRNTYLDTLTSLGRAKIATHADAIATKGGVMQKRDRNIVLLLKTFCPLLRCLKKGCRKVRSVLGLTHSY